MPHSAPPEVPTERPRRPLSLGAGAVVVHEGRVLLVRNIRGVTRGRYLLPAGRVDPDELPDRAAVREAFEETNLRVEVQGGHPVIQQNERPRAGANCPHRPPQPLPRIQHWKVTCP